MYARAVPGDFGSAWSRDAAAAAESGPGVLLSGGAGIGKTHYAAALMRSALGSTMTESGRPGVRWVRCPDLLMEIRGTFRDRAPRTEADVVASYRAVRLLVIDDLGAEKITDWSLSALYSILAGRIDELLPTIVTTNLGLSAIDAWEPRIASRLASFVAVRLPEVDRRLAKRRPS